MLYIFIDIYIAKLKLKKAFSSYLLVYFQMIFSICFIKELLEQIRLTTTKRKKTK